jgi:hypothetical protein
MSKLRWGLATGLALACATALCLPAQADPIHKIPHQVTPSFRMQSPLSTSVLIARAVKAGLIKPSAVSRNSLTNRAHLLTSTLPNVQASGGNGSSVANETPIVADPGNPKSLLSGANDYNCPSFQGFYFSSDAGATWTDTCFPLSSDPSVVGGYGDPGVAFDTNHVAYASGIDEIGNSFSDGAIVVAHWNSRRGAWTDPVFAAKVDNVFMDKPWLEVDTNANSQFKNALYVSMTEFSDTSNDISIGVTHSTDGGATWTLKTVDTVQFPAVDQFSDLAIGKDGTVYVSWMRCKATGPAGDCGGTTASLWISHSSDGGNTWSTPVRMLNANLTYDWCSCAFYGNLANTNERLSNVPVIAIDNSSAHPGTLYLANYSYDPVYHVARVEVSMSTDGGATWGRPVRVSSKKEKAFNDQFFPWLNVSPTGLLGVTWLDRRLDPANVSYDAFGTTSTDGATFAPNTRISDTSSNPFNDGFGGFFIGDYTGNTWARQSKTTPLTLFMSWTDTRSGEDQDEVGGLIP